MIINMLFIKFGVYNLLLWITNLFNSVLHVWFIYLTQQQIRGYEQPVLPTLPRNFTERHLTAVCIEQQNQCKHYSYIYNAPGLRIENTGWIGVISPATAPPSCGTGCK